MAITYKLTPIELVLSPKEYFEGNLSKFVTLIGINTTTKDHSKEMSLIALNLKIHYRYNNL